MQLQSVYKTNSASQYSFQVHFLQLLEYNHSDLESPKEFVFQTSDLREFQESKDGGREASIH